MSNIGIEMSNTDWTIDELIQSLQKIRQKHGNIPVRLCDESEWLHPENRMADNDCDHEVIIH